MSIAFLVKIAGIVYPLVEYWLGKTEKTKSGSVLELVINGVGKIISILKGSQNGN